LREGAEQVHELTGSQQTRLLPRELRVAEEDRAFKRGIRPDGVLPARRPSV